MTSIDPFFQDSGEGTSSGSDEGTQEAGPARASLIRRAPVEIASPFNTLQQTAPPPTEKKRSKSPATAPRRKGAASLTPSSGPSEETTAASLMLRACFQPPSEAMETFDRARRILRSYKTQRDPDALAEAAATVMRCWMEVNNEEVKRAALKTLWEACRYQTKCLSAAMAWVRAHAVRTAVATADADAGSLVPVLKALGKCFDATKPAQDLDAAQRKEMRVATEDAGAIVGPVACGAGSAHSEAVAAVYLLRQAVLASFP
ncbi:unnamed protein product, partial [Phaeothamnion confervicola]